MNTKNYLNSEFLNTAFFYKAPESKATISYLEWQEFDEVTGPNGVPAKEIGLKLKQKDIYCDKIIFSKDEKNSFILINTLITNLYNLYLELAKENDKSISKTTLKPKSNFLAKWIKGNSDILIQNKDTDIRRLVTKIIHASNAIAVNNRIGPATFIIISPKLLPIIQNTPMFTYDMSGKIKEYEAISQVGKLADLAVFVNYDSHDDTILVGRYSSQNNLGGVTLIEHDIQIDTKYITWIGAIDSYSPTSKYMFDLINVNLVDELPWYKRIVYKILKKRNMI
jgi:hypothetical protein